MKDRYFDNAATTSLDERVLAEMLPFFNEEYGNAHSIHGFGSRARTAVEFARKRVADLVGAEDPSQIVFTSGASEANNWAISGSVAGAIGPFEHSSLREPALRAGFEVLANEGHAVLPPSTQHPFVSVMRVDNETGSMTDAHAFRRQAVTLHSDLTQAVGKLATSVAGLDLASMSAHKFYGPKGIGALYAADVSPAPLIHGGEQEFGRRAGTLNVPGIVGMGAAAAIAADEWVDNLAHVGELRKIVLDELGGLSDVAILSPDNGSPYILNLSFLETLGETLVIEMDRRGFAIAAGAACSSRATEPSHVLIALHVSELWIGGAIRISFGKHNTKESTRNLVKALVEAKNSLHTMR